MVDRYVYGDVFRISPEAPVPVFDVESSKHYPGGAANTACNLIGLGGEVCLVGRVGDDEDGEWLTNYFSDLAKVSLVINKDVITERKTRFVTRSGQQVIRVDHASRDACPGYDHKQLLVALELAVAENEFNAVVISDYAKGTINAEIAKYLCSLGVPCFIDAKPVVWPQYVFAADTQIMFKPNQREFELLGGRVVTNGGVKSLSGFSELLCGVELLVTLGADGMVVAYGDEMHNRYVVPGFTHDVYNVIGAGDTALAAYAWARTCGFSESKSALVANVAASEVVSCRGTATISYDRIILATRRYSEAFQ